MKKLLFLFPFLLINCFSQTNFENKATKIFIVRHAEKADTSKNPTLTTAGEARAEKIAHILSLENLDAVFSTDFIRTIETVNNTASAKKLDVQKYTSPKKLAELIKNSLVGKTILVAVHSNTISTLAKEFGITHLPDNIEEYDNLFILTLINGTASFTRLKF